MTEQIRAPWTTEQVAALNAFQREGGMHPFTCGADHPGPSPALVARPDGWHCPGTYRTTCDYRQDWAHAFMADPHAWPKSPFGERHGPTPEEVRAAMLVQVGWYCWRCRAVNAQACRSDNVPVHVPAEWADEMRAEIARREDEDVEGEPAPAQDAPHAPQDGPQHPDAGAETPDGAGGRQTDADGRETLREQYAAALSTLTVLGGAPPAKLAPVIDWGAGKTTRIADWQPLDTLLDALLAVRDQELEQLRARLDEAQQNALALDQGREELFAVIRGVRAAVHVTDDEDVTDWQRGYRACSERVLAALDGKEQP